MSEVPHASLSDVERLILQYVARGSLEDTDDRDGWCRWGEPQDAPWAFQDYKPLVERGFLERRETWKDILLKLTEKGVQALWYAPAIVEDQDPRRGVRGQVVDGDVLP